MNVFSLKNREIRRRCPVRPKVPAVSIGCFFGCFPVCFFDGFLFEIAVFALFSLFSVK